MATPTSVAPNRGPTRFPPLRQTSWLAGAWRGLQIVSNSATSVTLDYTTCPNFEWALAIILLGDPQTDLPRPPDGWQEIKQGREGTPGGAGCDLIVWGRYKQPTDTAQQFTWGTSCAFAAIPFAWLGLDPQTPFESVVYTAHTSGTTFPTGTVAPTRNDRRVAGIFAERGSTSTGSFIPPAGMTQRVDFGSTSNPWCLLTIADTIGTVGKTGVSYTATCTATSSHGGAIGLALIPAGAADIQTGRISTSAFPSLGRPGRFRFQLPQLDTTAATPGATATGSSSAHCSTSCTGAKGGVGAAASTQHSTTTDTGRKNASAAAAAIAHPTTADTAAKGGVGGAASTTHNTTTAAASQSTGRTGTSTTHVTTSATGRKGGIGASASIAHPATSSTTRKQATGQAASYAHNSTTGIASTTTGRVGASITHITTAASARKQGTAVASSSTHVATSCTGKAGRTGVARSTTHTSTTNTAANVAAFTPAYVSIDGAGSTGGVDSTHIAQTTDSAGTAGGLDGAASTGSQECATTAAGYV